jgi:hypothetical protein
MVSACRRPDRGETYGNNDVHVRPRASDTPVRQARQGMDRLPGLSVRSLHGAACRREEALMPKRRVENMTEAELIASMGEHHLDELEARRAQGELTRRATKASVEAASQLVRSTEQLVTATQALGSMTRRLAFATWVLVIFTLLIGAGQLYVAMKSLR